MLSTQEWAQLKSWLIQAQLKATTTSGVLSRGFGIGPQTMSALSLSSKWPSSGTAPATGMCIGWRASILALASTPLIRLPPLLLALAPCDGQSAAASDSGLDPAAASAASPGLGTRFGEEYPHFPNGHRRLGLTPQVLVECQSWIREARDCHNRLGFTSGDWLVYWIPETKCVV